MSLKALKVFLGTIWFSQSLHHVLSAAPTATTTTTTTIQATPDSSQLSSHGSQAGCDHYRNGYLGLALCVNFYDDTANGKSFVQVVGSLTNEGQVDICNMTLSIGALETATYKNPTWLPTYPKDQSFKAGTYFPFSAVIPMDPGSAASYNYPTVDVLRGFFACDASLKQLPEDQVVPPPGTGRNPIPADDDYPGSSKEGFGSKIRWVGFLSSAGSNSQCLSSCLQKLNKMPDDCSGAAYILQSGCIKSCPSSVSQWTRDACLSAKCKAEQCALGKSISPAASNRSPFSSILLTAIYASFLIIWLWY